MRLAGLVISLAACGRLGFDTPRTAPDAARDAAQDTPPAMPRFVAGTAQALVTTASLDMTIPATGAGSLVVVGLTQESGTTATIASITDGAGDTYQSANARSIDTTCANTAEIWYAGNVIAGVTTVSIAMSSNVTIEAWVVELAGVGQLVGGGHIDSHASSAMVSAPTVVTTGPAAVLSTVTTCGAVTAIANGGPFTALAIENGEDTAYLIADAPGTYGAVWSYGGGSWNATTAAFQ